MIDYKKRGDITTKILLILFSIFVVNKTFTLSVLNYDVSFSLVRKIILYSVYIIFVIYIICKVIKKNKINLKWWWLLVISLIITIISKNTEPIIALLIILTFKDIKPEKIVRVCFWSNIFSLFIIILLYLVNIIPDYKYFSGTSIRHSLGFYYPTFPSTILFFIVLMRLFIKKGKIGIFETLIYIVAILIMYKYTLSKTGLILSVAVVIFSLICKILNLLKIDIESVMRSNVITVIIYILPIIILLFSIGTAVSYNSNSKFMVSLNKVLNNRLEVAHKTINNEGISLFGKNITWIGNGGRWYEDIPEGEYNFVDNAYLKMMLDCGIIYLIVFMLIIIKNQRKLIEKKEYISLFIIFIILLWGISEPNILDLEKNVFLIMIFSNVIDKN